MEIKERIEKESGIKFKDFPDIDFELIEAILKEHKKVEVWLLKGMGRRYLRAFLPNKNNSNLPMQEKLCELTNK